MKFETINDSVEISISWLYKVVHEFNRTLIKDITSELKEVMIKRDFDFIRDEDEFDLAYYMSTSHMIKCKNKEQRGHAFLLNFLIHSNDEMLKIVAMIYGWKEKIFFVEKNNINWFLKLFNRLIEEYQYCYPYHYNNGNEEQRLEEIRDIKNFFQNLSENNSHLMIHDMEEYSSSAFNHEEISVGDFFELDNWQEIIQELKDDNVDFYSLDWEELPNVLLDKVYSKEQIMENMVQESKQDSQFKNKEIISLDSLSTFYYEQDLDLNDYVEYIKNNELL